jgi:hypothetical protein
MVNLGIEAGIDDQGPHVTLVHKLSGQRLRFTLGQAVRLSTMILSATVATEDTLIQMRAEAEKARQGGVVAPKPAPITDIRGKPIV